MNISPRTRAARPQGLPPPAWLFTFAAAARCGSFTAAAAELNLTQAAVSQQIRKLESLLGVALFERRARSVRLTEHAASYLPHVEAAFAGLFDSTQELFARPAAAELVSLSLPVSFATLWLAPRLPELTVALPTLRLGLSTVHLPDDYERASADLEIRYGRSGDWPGREALRLTVESLVPVAHPRLVLRGGRGRTRGWLTLPRLAVVGARELWPAWFAARKVKPPLAESHRFDSFVTALAAAEAGSGVLLGSRPLIDASLGAGRLKRLDRLALATERGHHLLVAPAAQRRPLVRGLLAWFRRQIIA